MGSSKRLTVRACNTLEIETSARKENYYKKSWHRVVWQYGQTAVARQHKNDTKQIVNKVNDFMTHITHNLKIIFCETLVSIE